YILRQARDGRKAITLPDTKQIHATRFIWSSTMNRSGTQQFIPSTETRHFTAAPSSPMFERMAEGIVGRLAELLYARVWLLDRHETVVASSAPMSAGYPAQATDHADTHAILRIPLHLDGQSSVLVVGESLNGESVSLRLVHALAQLVIN